MGMSGLDHGMARTLLPPIAPRLNEVGPRERTELAGWIEDSPRVALALGSLIGGLSRAYVVGDASCPRAAVIHIAEATAEPEVLGGDPAAAWSILSRLPGWQRPHLLSDGLADPLCHLMESELKVPVRREKDLQYVLRTAPVDHRDARVRPITIADLEVVERSDRLTQPRGHGDVRTTLSRGVVGGAVVGDRLVSSVMSCAWGGVHVNLGAATAKDWRGQGLASAETVLVCRALQERGLRPCWCTGPQNMASQRVAEKVGFELVQGGEYLIPEGPPGQALGPRAPETKGPHRGAQPTRKDISRYRPPRIGP